MDNPILLITTEISSHANALEYELRGLNANYSRINTDSINKKNWPSLKFNNKCKWVEFLDSNNTLRNLYDFKAIWHEEIYPNPELFKDIPYGQWSFLETKKAMEWLLLSSETPTINSLESIISGSNKINQLRRASELGMKIPDTLISSNYISMKNFVVDKAVYKPISRPTPESIGDNKIILTSIVDDSDLSEESTSAKLSLLQRYVKKRLEIRTYVIADNVMSVEIHNQKSKISNIDWRNYDIANTPHYIHSLPNEIADACKKLTHSFNLKFSAIDMILTPENEYYFLELNPQGLWLWLEKLTEIQITKTLAQELVKLSKDCR